MTLETLENKRKRLIFRSWHRGTREMDLIMGSFADRYVSDFSEDELDQYDQILKITDVELYAWYTGKEVVPEKNKTEILSKLLTHSINY